MRTVSSSTGRPAACGTNSPLNRSASSATVIPCACAIGSRPTKEAYALSSTGPVAERPVTGFGRSRTRKRLPASAAATMQSYSVQM